MTFLCTRDGELVAGAGHPWPQPWGFECDTCHRRFPYSCNALSERQKLTPPTMRLVGADVHRCAYCEGYVEQLELFGAAA